MTNSRLDFRRISTLAVAWILVVWFSVAFLWDGNSQAFPFGGARGILDNSISGPLLFVAIGYATILSIPKFNGPPLLFTGAGIWFAGGLALSFYVANSASTVLLLAGAVFFREGHRLFGNRSG